MENVILIATVPGAYWAIGAAWILGIIVGMYLSAHQNPMAIPAMLEAGKRQRIEAEMIYLEWVEIRTGQRAPVDRHDQYIRDCNMFKFARRVEQMFRSYDQHLRASEVYVHLMTEAGKFEIIQGDPTEDQPTKVRYTDPTEGGNVKGQKVPADPLPYRTKWENV